MTDDKELEELKQELAFYKSQTKVLRKKNRDLRNALLLAEAKGDEKKKEPRETAEESVSDIKKVIADSKKQISQKLSEFKKTLEDKEGAKAVVKKSPGGAPEPKTSTLQEPVEAESLKNQVTYLKREVDRLEKFLEQSEMVNDRLRVLLAEHSIDVSDIQKAIHESSRSVLSQEGKKIQQKQQQKVTKEKVEPKPKQEPIQPQPTKIPQTQTPTKKEEPVKLDPAIKKIFDEFRQELTKGLQTEEIPMELLEVRDKLMELIPHSRVFYEMQREYRLWKRGNRSVADLQESLETWEKTIADTL
ncbi:MAG: hypothetical protein U9O98_04730 [Asgard group archaeon]|nr:hypothetical protein [Asgard group archaeon]